MTSLPLALDDCWNRIGVHGDGTCPELATAVHCHNCPVFSRSGRRFLDSPSPEGYLEEWTQRLAAPLEEPPEGLVTVLSFALGEEWLALPVHVLVEVTEPRPIHRVPHRGGLLAGLVNIRGELHLCVRLARLLGIPDAGRTTAPAGRHRLLVIQKDADRWVFPVAEVDRIHRPGARELAKAPATLARSGRRLTSGVFTRQERAIGLLDDGRLFDALRAGLR
jgi:chemotaxis-related protein WspD